MCAKKHEEGEAGIPEYMVSYADMLTIMLAFFIVLYATTGTTSEGKSKGEKAGHGAVADQEAKGTDRGSGPKEGYGGKDSAAVAQKGDATKEPSEKTAGANTPQSLNKVFESLYYRFGPEWTLANCWVGGPAQLRSLGSSASKSGTTGKDRAKGLRGYKGNDPLQARAPKPGDHLLVAGRIYFDEFSADLHDPQVAKLRRAVEELAGKIQKIEIRGHTSRRPLPPGSPYRDHWELAFERCRRVKDFLVGAGIDPARIRLGVAADNEPLELDGDILAAKHNSRVEIHWLNEYVRTPSGVRNQAFDQSDRPKQPAPPEPAKQPSSATHFAQPVASAP